MTRTHTRRLLALVVVAGLLAPLGMAHATAAAPETTTIDANHGLASDTAIAEYRETGHAAASLTVPDMRLAVGDDVDGDRLDGSGGNPAYVYFQIQYNETIERTMRIHVPAAYWFPSPQDIDAAEAGVTAEFRPTADNEYTTVTVTLSEPGTYTFAVPAAASAVFQAREEGTSWIENTTNITIPSILPDGSWQTVEPDTVSVQNYTYPPIRSNDSVPQVQYRTADGNWLTVPECDATLGDDEPVCRNRVRNYTVVRVRAGVTDPPAIRYRRESGLLPDVSSITDGVSETVDRIMKDIGGLFGGDGGETDG